MANAKEVFGSSYFQHDNDASSDLKILAMESCASDVLEADYDWRPLAAYGAWNKFLEACSSERCKFITLSERGKRAAIARRMTISVEQLDAMLDLFADVGLIEKDMLPGAAVSSSMVNRAAYIESKSAAGAKGARTRVSNAKKNDKTE